MTFYVLSENEPNEGGTPLGIYSTPEKARDAAAERPLSPPDFNYYSVHPLELDAPANDRADYHLID